MTIGEAVRAFEAYEDRRKDQAYFVYTNAMTVGMFIGSMFSHDSPPSISDIYPKLFTKDEEAEEVARETQSAANFINFANAFNKDFDNGSNGTTESENNG